ncbi:protein of unknown function [Stenotrophomonas maltophilia]|nr:protein of unknown function [Stenotrophomonas maltophilia]
MARPSHRDVFTASPATAPRHPTGSPLLQLQLQLTLLEAGAGRSPADTPPPAGLAE